MQPLADVEPEAPPPHRPQFRVPPLWSMLPPTALQSPVLCVRPRAHPAVAALNAHQSGSLVKILDTMGLGTNVWRELVAVGWQGPWLLLQGRSQDLVAKAQRVLPEVFMCCLHLKSVPPGRGL